MNREYGAYLLNKPLYRAIDWALLSIWLAMAIGTFIYAGIKAYSFY